MIETIYSLVTKPINQNVAIIKISGPDTYKVVKDIFNNKVKKEQAKVFVTKLHDKKNNYIDDVVVLTWVSPNTYTGEDLVEIQCHGSMFVVQKILDIISKTGIRQAKRGEFTQQAVINGKMDLSQSIALNTLINAENKFLANVSSENLNGTQSKFLKESLDFLQNTLATIQIAIDYPENTDLPQYNLKTISSSIKKFNTKLNKIITDSQKLVNVSKGIIITLVGAPNVGKSSLLNELLKENRAIVSEIAGTTRDIIESNIFINGIKCTLQDTAGIRDSKDKIEKEGIKRTFEALSKSHLIVLLIDSTKPIKKQMEEYKDIIKKYEEKVILTYTKSDLKNIKEVISISSKKHKIDSLIKEIEKRIKNNYFDEKTDVDAILINDEQINSFKLINKHLENTYKFISQNNTVDAVMWEIEIALKEIGKLLGIEIDDEYMVNIFNNFCVGK